MNNFFDQAFDYLMRDEGFKYVNDPKDSGGPTRYGITQKSYEDYVKRIVTIDEIKNMSIDEAKKFYLERYWKPIRCNDLTSLPVAVCLFDSAVLYGSMTATILAQKAASLCGATLKFDGLLGDKSVEALNTVKSVDFLGAFHGLVLARIEAVISSNPKDEVYRDGWTNRAGRLLTLNNLVPVINETT
jgi:lysozyme family protein